MHERTQQNVLNDVRPGDARVVDRLRQLRRERFVGRQRELAQLDQCVRADGPAVTFLHGMAGMGKSALLEVFEERLGARGIRTLHLDARGFEPTPRGSVRHSRASSGSQPRARNSASRNRQCFPRK